MSLNKRIQRDEGEEQGGGSGTQDLDGAMEQIIISKETSGQDRNGSVELSLLGRNGRKGTRERRKTSQDEGRQPSL